MLHPITPADVRAMRPSEVASVLGLDRTETIIAVALDDGDFVDTATADIELVVPQHGEQRLRRVK